VLPGFLGFFGKSFMGCLLPIIAIFMPRVALFLIFVFSNWFSRAFQTTLWPLLGFHFLPYTTLAWMAAMILNDHQLNGLWIGVLVIAVLFDLGGQGHSARRRWARD
jgi:hypothetical protein